MDIRKSIFIFASLALFATILGGYFYFSVAHKLAIQREHEKAKDFISNEKNPSFY